jgi:DNA helicase-2/ATP-dependent DNA helicase PcrA
VFYAALHGGRHIMVEALAGTGKTWTMVEMFNRMPVPVPAGRRVVSSTQPYCSLAFNKSIAQVLQARMPSYVKSATFHSLGRSALVTAGFRFELDQDKKFNIVTEADQYLHPFNARQVVRLASLCQNQLIDSPTPEDLDAFAIEHGIEIDEKVKERVYGLVPYTLTTAKSMTGLIDFDDMIWLPMVLDIPLPQFEFMAVDEVQDLNYLQQQFALKSAKRLALVGDKHQAIYAFRGADDESMENMLSTLSDTRLGCDVLPLTVTRRCARLITEFAAQIVPEFECLEDAPEGSIDPKYTALPKPGEMVVCRTNAPLIGYAYQLMKMDTPLRIQGRDVGQSLLAHVRKLVPNPAGTTAELVEKAEESYRHEMSRLSRSQSARVEAMQQTVQDRYECILALSEGLTTVSEVTDRVARIFVDVSTPPDNLVLLSSVHRAKGLEAESIHILEPNLMPHPSAKSKTARKQEMNLLYVARTRPKLNLYLRS